MTLLTHYTRRNGHTQTHTHTHIQTDGKLLCVVTIYLAGEKERTNRIGKGKPTNSQHFALKLNAQFYYFRPSDQRRHGSYLS